MAIRNVVIPTDLIRVKNKDGSEGEIEVRGLAAADIMELAQKHGPAMVLVFAKIKSGGASFEEAEVRQLIWEVASEFPDMLAAGLALAADEYNAGGIEIMRKLPIETQMEVIHKVFSLSFASEGALGKLMSQVVEMMVGVQTAMRDANLTSMTGIGASDETSAS